MKSFIEKVNWKAVFGSTSVGEWRQEDWVEAEVELCYSCSRNLFLSCGRSGTKMVLQNYPKLGWGARTLYSYLNPQWPDIGCRLTVGRCDFGQGSISERTQLRAISSQHYQQLGYERGIWGAHHCDDCRWNQDFESCVYERVITQLSLSYDIHSAKRFVRCWENGEEKKVGKDFWFVGKDEVGFRTAEFGIEGEMLSRSLGIW